MFLKHDERTDGRVTSIVMDDVSLVVRRLNVMDGWMILTEKKGDKSDLRKTKVAPMIKRCYLTAKHFHCPFIHLDLKAE